jgi:hypothetical protein
MNDEKELWDAIVLKLVASPICDQERPETTATRIISARRAFFDQGIGADLTGPKKPTKPIATFCEDCQGTGQAANDTNRLDQCLRCKGSGYL